MDDKQCKYFLVSFVFLNSYLCSAAQETRKVRSNGVDFSLNVKKNDSPYFMLSSEVSLVFIPKKISLDFGAGLIVSTNAHRIYDEISWNIGLKFFGDTIRKKFLRQFGLAFQQSKFKYDVEAYDIAVPNIPVKATITHEVERNEFIMYFGLRYLITKKIFAQANGGITYSAYRDIDQMLTWPDEKPKFKPVMQLYGCIGIGMTL